MSLPSALTEFAFDADAFATLRQRLVRGELDPRRNRLPQAPSPLRSPPLAIPQLDAHTREDLRARGYEALRAGKMAALVLNGGMATRFGGGAKGIVSIVRDQPLASFLATKLAQIEGLETEASATIPVVLMHSFATAAATEAHLRELDDAHPSRLLRASFLQSIMPRVGHDGTPLYELATAADFSTETLYAAPGHGDTLPRFRESGVLEQLRQRGVEHVLISNVDNLGATLDPVLVGAHLEAVARGKPVSVEVVRRIEGDAGGCVAELPNGTPAIIEGFRLPETTDLAAYPHFNTNTLWVALSALEQPVELEWFAVRKTIEWPARDEATGQREIVQFERLIGQLTEFVPTEFLEVDRDARFVPIKTRDDLVTEQAKLLAIARAAGVA